MSRSLAPILLLIAGLLAAACSADLGRGLPGETAASSASGAGAPSDTDSAAAARGEPDDPADSAAPVAHGVEAAAPDAPADRAAYPFVWLEGTDPWEPEYFRLLAPDTMRVLGGPEHRVTADSIVIQVPGHDVLEAALAAPYGPGVIIFYQAGSGGEGAAGVAFADLAERRISWKTDLLTMNLAEPAIRDGSLYIAAWGLVAKLDIASGRVLWQHDGLYDAGRFNLMRPPEFAGDTVVFRDRDGAVLRVLDRSGEVVPPTPAPPEPAADAEGP